jgi:hypothetical protein
MDNVDQETVKPNGSAPASPGTPPADLAIVPGSLTDLASRLDDGMAIIKAREMILETARHAGVRMTEPEDWLLFKDKQGRTVGYLQDCGCERVRPIFGISTFDVGRPEKLPLADGGFIYTITGSGRCALTQEIIENVMGGRASTDDYITRQDPPLKGAQLELAVMKAARSNLEGNITRALAGLKTVPLEEIEEIFSPDKKKTRARFREGRGFGKQADRAQNTEGAPHQAANGEKHAGDFISEGQRKRMYAIWKNAGWQDSEVKEWLLREYSISSSTEVPKDKYEEICKALEAGGSH